MFWVGRHGQGNHNLQVRGCVYDLLDSEADLGRGWGGVGLAQEAKVGTEEWDTKWSKLTGDGTIVVRSIPFFFSILLAQLLTPNERSGVPIHHSQRSGSPKPKLSTSPGRTNGKREFRCPSPCIPPLLGGPWRRCGSRWATWWGM